mgnify:CR=1 FL=1
MDIGRVYIEEDNSNISHIEEYDVVLVKAPEGGAKDLL